MLDRVRIMIDAADDDSIVSVYQTITTNFCSLNLNSMGLNQTNSAKVPYFLVNSYYCYRCISQIPYPSYLRRDLEEKLPFPRISKICSYLVLLENPLSSVHHFPFSFLLGLANHYCSHSFLGAAFRNCSWACSYCCSMRSSSRPSSSASSAG